MIIHHDQHDQLSSSDHHGLHMASWECVVRDGVLDVLLRQMTTVECSWDFQPRGELPTWLQTQCSIEDVENAAEASPLWKKFIVASPEWAAVRLARWEYTQETGVVWLPYNEYVVNGLLQNWALFSRSFIMETPIACPRLRLLPLGSLSEPELLLLRTLLWNPGNRVITSFDAEPLSPAPHLWVCQKQRL